MPSVTHTGAGLATLAQTHGSIKWYKDRAYCRSNDRIKSGTETPHRYSVYQGRGRLLLLLTTILYLLPRPIPLLIGGQSCGSRLNNQSHLRMLVRRDILLEILICSPIPTLYLRSRYCYAMLPIPTCPKHILFRPPILSHCPLYLSRFLI